MQYLSQLVIIANFVRYCRLYGIQALVEIMHFLLVGLLFLRFLHPLLLLPPVRSIHDYRKISLKQTQPKYLFPEPLCLFQLDQSIYGSLVVHIADIKEGRSG
jgi:hypothetical protein